MAEIYALIDRQALDRRKIRLEDLAAYCAERKIPIVQYRNKVPDSNRIRKDLRTIRALYDGIVILNDHLRWVDEADGLHLGQEDLAALGADPVEAIESLRGRIGRKRLGLSTHGPEEIERANGLDLDYIGLGAYRRSPTKEDASVSGATLLEWACDSRHPVALIGGVRWEDDLGPCIRYKVLGSALYERFESGR